MLCRKKTISNKRKLQGFAILPPCFLSDLVDEEDLDASHIFLKFVSRIKKIRNGTLSDDDDTATYGSEFTEELSLGNVIVHGNDEAEAFDQPNVDAPADLTAEGDEFYPILLFLWSVLKKGDVITGSPMIICSKKLTTTWENSQHIGRVQQTASPASKSTSMAANTEAMNTFSQNMTEFNNALTASKLGTTRDPTDDTDNGMKRFKRFPLVHRNMIRLLTLTPSMTEDDINDLKPTENVVDILGCPPPPASIQSQLNYLLEANGNLAYAEASACTALRHGLLISSPNPNSPNGTLCLWLYPHESYGEVMSAEKRIQFAEQEGKAQEYDTFDLALLTEAKISLPRSFDGFLHMLRNIWHVTEILAGTASICALEWGRAVQHARDNEGLYRRLARDDKYFYTSLACDYHRWYMTYIKSLGHGKFTKIAFNQFVWHNIFQAISEEVYTVKIPSWMKTITEAQDKKRKREPDDAKGGPVPAGAGRALRQRTPRRGFKEKENYVVNPDKSLADLIPSDLTYPKLLHPKILVQIPKLTHEDGSIRCNNWHHRGNCHDKYDFIDSHNKVLITGEKAKGKNMWRS